MLFSLIVSWINLFAVTYNPFGTTCVICGSGGITQAGFQQGNFLNYIEIQVKEDVTSIGDNSFDGCFAIQTISLPNSLTSIGNKAFYGCKKLNSINIPPNVGRLGTATFYQCSSLVSITIPNEITLIGYECFRYCSSLKTVTIDKENSKLDTIADYAFADSSLDSIVFPNSLTTIQQFPFLNANVNTINIPPLLQTIGNGLFANSQILSFTIEGNPYFQLENQALVSTGADRTLVSFPPQIKGNYVMLDTILFVKAYAFQHSCLTSIKLSSSVTRLTERCYRYAFNLESFTGAENVVSTEMAPFESDPKLKTFIFGNNFKTLGTWAFVACSALANVVLPPSLESLGEMAFNGCINLKSITIPKNLTKWGTGAFQNCGNLNITIDPENKNFVEYDTIIYSSNYVSIVYVPPHTENVEIKAELKVLGKGVFQGLRQLVSVKFPPNLVSIGQSCFNSCSALLKAEIPPTVTSLDMTAFQGCTKLSEVIFLESADPPVSLTIQNNAFQSCGIVVFTIPARTIMIYKEAFRLCAQLEKLIILGNPIIESNNFIDSSPNLVEIYLEMIAVQSQLFLSNTNLVKVVFGIDVKTIKTGSFYGNSKLTTIEFVSGNQIESIESMAFSLCNSLETINLPSSINQITASSFSGCNSLTTINIAQSSITQKYITFNEGVYESNYQTFVLMPSGLPSISIDPRVNTLGSQAFYGCKKLQSVELGVNLIEISDECFYECDELLSVTIPIEIQRIGERAFGSCLKLKNVFYCGASDSNITVLTNPFSANTIVYVNADYVNPNDTFCGNKIIRSLSKDPLGCPIVPSKEFTRSKKEPKLSKALYLILSMVNYK